MLVSMFLLLHAVWYSTIQLIRGCIFVFKNVCLLYFIYLLKTTEIRSFHLFGNY